MTRTARRRAIAVAVTIALAASGCLRPGNPSITEETVSPPEPIVVFGAPLPEHAKLTLETDAGTIRCDVDPARVPRGAAIVVALARGKASFRDMRSGQVMRRPFYDGLTFFRRVPGEMIQTGCQIGDGAGFPGFRIAVEPTAADQELLRHPGALLLAHYQPPPLRADPNPPPADHVIGSQLIVALAPMTQNRGAVTVLGRCGDLDVVRRLSMVPRDAPAPVLRTLRASW